MPLDPVKPADGSPLESAEMRAQLTALNDNIQSRFTIVLMNATVQ